MKIESARPYLLEATGSFNPTAEQPVVSIDSTLL